VLSWSGDIGIRGFVNEMVEYVSVIAFGIGLTFGLTFDTTGPRRAVATEPMGTAATTTAPSDGRAADEPVARERRGGFLRRRDRVTAR
jgi:hypothetical protein